MDIQTGRFGRYVQALLNLKTRLTLGQALPDVMPVLDLERVRPEMEMHTGNSLAGTLVRVTAVAGETGRAVMLMPANSGKVAIVERIEVNVGTATASFNLSQVLVPPTTTPASTTPQWRDVRLSGVPVCTFGIDSDTVLLANPIANLRNAAGSMGLFLGPYVLANVNQAGGILTPALVVECETANQAFNVSWQWRERQLEPQERIL